MKSPAGDADDRGMFALPSETWVMILVALGFASFAAGGAMAFALDTKVRIATLRVDARRMQLRALRERARRLYR